MENRITVNWIPGHKGHDSNEMADYLAKMGSKSENRNDTTKIPHKIIISHIIKYYNDCHINRWNFSDPQKLCLSNKQSTKKAQL